MVWSTQWRGKKQEILSVCLGVAKNPWWKSLFQNVKKKFKPANKTFDSIIQFTWQWAGNNQSTNRSTNRLSFEKMSIAVIVIYFVFGRLFGKTADRSIRVQKRLIALWLTHSGSPHGTVSFVLWQGLSSVFTLVEPVEPTKLNGGLYLGIGNVLFFLNSESSVIEYIFYRNSE